MVELAGFVGGWQQAGSGGSKHLHLELPMFHWRLLPGSGDSVESSVIETVDFRLLVQDTATRGYRDLSVTGTAARDDGQPSKGKPFRYRLRYDGRAYFFDSMFESFRRWIGR
jgi:hypothetical protein